MPQQALEITGCLDDAKRILCELAEAHRGTLGNQHSVITESQDQRIQLVMAIALVSIAETLQSGRLG